MNGYPDGCGQADHDRAFNESLSDEPGDDVVRLDCGCYDTEDRGEAVGGKLVCPKCIDRYLRAEKQAKVQALLMKYLDPKPQFSGIMAREFALMILEITEAA